MPMKLSRSTPESQGVSSRGIVSFLREMDTVGLHGFMLLRHGKVVAETWYRPYRPEIPHMLYSLSKSFTSTAVGLAVADGLLTVDDTVLGLFPDEAPKKPSKNLAAMKVRHLLSMSTGHDADATNATMRNGRGNPYRAFLRVPVAHEPGTHFVYNSAASFMLSAIVQKLTGKTLVEYLTPRLFEPLGIEDVTWESHPNGVNFGGWGLFLKTEDIAKFGQLYLKKGKVGGKQLIPKSWVDEATAKHVENGDDPESDWNQGYGYQFWRCKRGCYRGDGAFGQYCIVMPDYDAVVAITSGVGNMQAVLDSVWNKLLPAMAPTRDAATSASPRSAATLEKMLASRAIAPPEGKTTSRREKSFSGRTYTFEANEQHLNSVCFDFAESTLTYRDSGGPRGRAGGGTHTIRFGRGEWVDDHVGPGAPGMGPVSSAGVWIAENALKLVVCQTNTPHIITIICRFRGDTVEWRSTMNVSFDQKEPAVLTGTASARPAAAPKA